MHHSSWSTMNKIKFHDSWNFILSCLPKTENHIFNIAIYSDRTQSDLSNAKQIWTLIHLTFLRTSLTIYSVNYTLDLIFSLFKDIHANLLLSQMSNFGKVIVLDCRENFDCKIQDVKNWDPIYTIFVINISLGAFGFLTNLLW